MNAKEISDSTLESVTPADNDLMLIYDTSEGTTGKATISDIAPKVAENIDISTLPAVTPAADDVLMIGDTSAGTTGKATISDIAPKVAENILPQIDAKINNIIKRGTVIVPSSTSGVPAVNVLVTFDTPFEDANYALELTRIGYTYYAETYIVYINKTKNGFHIEEFCNDAQLIRPAHEVSWVAIKI